VQRENAAARVAGECAAAKKAWKREDDDKIKVRRFCANIGETSLIKLRNDLVATQLQLYNNNKESFIAALGQEAYDKKIIELLNELPDPEQVPIGCADDNNVEEEDKDDDALP